MAVSKRLRYEILRRDNNTCRYCGGSAPDVVLTVDHVVPTALGGSDDPTNLVAACKDCNAGKTSSSPDAPLVADVSDRAVQWGAAIARWATQRRDERYERDCYVDQFTDAWDLWRYGPDDDRKKVPKPGGWEASIWQFYEAGLPVEELEDAIKIALGRDRVQLEEKFRYMCGVAWKQVEKMHDAARDLVEPRDQQADEVPEDEEARLFEVFDGLIEQGRDWAFEVLGFSDLPHKMLTGHVDGRKSFLDDPMRWVA